MSLILHPFQADLESQVAQAMRVHKSILLQSATGSGKTAMATSMTKRAITKGNAVYFICHRQELLDQTAKTFKKGGIDHVSFIANGWHHEPHVPVQICSINTLANRVSKIVRPRIAIWDEAHHLGAQGWTNVKNIWCDSYHIGLSATPERLDGKGLGIHFQHLIKGPEVRWLIDNKYLSDYILYAPTVPDTSQMHTKMGDYVKADIAQAMDKSSISGDIVKHWLKFARGKRTIGFSYSVEHSMHMAELFRNAGIMSVHLDGTSKLEERKAAARAFAANDIQVIWNVDLFGEGYDLSAQADSDVTVDAVIQARPTQSFALYRQQIGRALRTKADGSKAIILDHAGNWLRHGFPDDPYEWSLEGRSKGSRTKQEIELIRCDKCFRPHVPAPKCPFCGYLYPVNSSPRQVEHREGELAEIDKERMRRERLKEQTNARGLEGLIELGKKKGYKNPEKWAAHVWTSRQVKKRTKEAQELLAELADLKIFIRYEETKDGPALFLVKGTLKSALTEKIMATLKEKKPILVEYLMIAQAKKSKVAV